MSGLSPADRADIYSLVGECVDDAREGYGFSDTPLVAHVEAIVSRAVNEALTEAAMEVDRTAAICIDAHGPGCIGGISYRDAARIVRARTT